MNISMKLSPKLLLILALMNLGMAILMANSGSHFHAMLNFFVGGFILSEAIEQMMVRRSENLLEQCKSLLAQVSESCDVQDDGR